MEAKELTAQPETDKEASGEQREWCRFAGELRDRLAAKMNDIDSMTCDDLDGYVNACTGAFYLSLKSNSFDRLLELEMSRTKAVE